MFKKIKGRTVGSTKVSISMTKSTALVSIPGLIVAVMKGSGSMENSMGKVN
jgi:hypothetical protein